MALIGTREVGLGGSDGGGFRAVLKRLSQDQAYLQETTTNPRKILEDFPDLTLQELDSLRDAAVLSGVDVREIEPLHDGIANMRFGQALGDGDITACCCCCCCGVTGAIRRV